MRTTNTTAPAKSGGWREGGGRERRERRGVRGEKEEKRERREESEYLLNQECGESVVSQ